MARILSVGWDTFSPDEQQHPSYKIGTPSTDNSFVRNLGKSYPLAATLKCDSGAGNATVAWQAAINTYQMAATVTGRWYYLRHYLMFPSGPTTYAWIGGVYRWSGNANGIILAVGTGLNLDCVVYQNNAQTIEASGFTFTANTWCRVELGVYIDAAFPTNGQWELRIDGVTMKRGTGYNFQTTAIDTVNIGWITNPGANKVLYVDDLALNDSSGNSQNSWPGPGKLILLKPVSDVARGANWLAGGGGNSNLFDAVDNRPPAGVALGSGTNTSQIKNVAADASGNYDLLTQSADAAGGIRAVDKITLAMLLRSQGSDSTTATDGAFREVDNPTVNAEVLTSFPASGVIAGTYPTGWPWLCNSPIYDPLIDRSRGATLRVGKRQATTRAGMVDFLGMYLEATEDLDLNSGMQRVRGYLSGYAPDQDKSALSLPAAAPNIVINPSFEVDLASWGVFGTGTSALRINTDAAPGFGSACLELTFNGVNDYGVSASYSVQAGREYTLSGWIKRANGLNGFVAIQFYDSYSQFNALGLPNSIFVSGTGGAWQFYTQTFTIPLDIGPTVGMYLYGLGSPSGTARFDGINLVPTTNRRYLPGVMG